MPDPTPDLPPNALIPLDRWCLRETGSRYTAPELRRPYLEGVVGGRPVTTAILTAADGRVMTCDDGTKYVLVDPDPNYAAFVASIGKAIDPERPITFRGA